MRQLEKDEEFNEALTAAGDKLVVVDFFATWCIPCKKIAPFLEELAEAHEGVVFLKVDVDQLEDTAAEQDISAMPTFLFFKNGKKVDELVGASKDALQAAVEKLA